MPTPRSLRDEKVKLLRQVRTIDPTHVVRGQYRGYVDEDGVEAGSDVETYVAVRFEIDSWRWAGVPWLIRTGKHLAGERRPRRSSSSTRRPACCSPREGARARTRTTCASGSARPTA